MPQTDFPFIVSSGPKLQNDPSIRTVIRKQAMKDVGHARRKRGRKVRGEGEDGCTTAPMQSAASSSDDGSGNGTPSTSSDDATFDELIPRRLPIKATGHLSLLSSTNLLTDYEFARSRFQVDVADLSMLTSFYIGRPTLAALAADPSNLKYLLNAKQWSFVEFVPSRYGSSKCITAATNCVLAKVRSILAPDEFTDSQLLLRLYSRALQTLQDAIADPSNCLDSDVLCATQLLSIHELLDPTRAAAWDQHLWGSTRLVKARTPTRFQTDFEKALFAAHVGPVVSEALTSIISCYLAQPEWMELYRSLVIDTDELTDRSPLTIAIRSVTFFLPDLWRDVDTAINDDATLFDDAALQALEARCRALHSEILAWTEDYKAHCVRWSLSTPSPAELAMRRENFGLSIECLIIVKRLLSTVCDAERPQLELETQALAHLLLELQKNPVAEHSFLFAGHEVGVAYMIEFTRDQWDGMQTYASEYERRMAVRMRYNTWTTLLRMPD